MPLMNLHGMRHPHPRHDRVRLLLRRWCAALLLLLALPLTVVAQTAPEPSPLIYTDQLDPSWANWSWDTTLDPASSAPVHTGARALAVTYRAGWAGLSLRTARLQPGHHSLLQFWVHGGSGPHRPVGVFAVDRQGQWVSLGTVMVAPGQWRLVQLSLARVPAPGFHGLVWQNRSGQAQAPFFLDEIQLRPAAAAPPPAPTSAPPPLPTVAPPPAPTAPPPPLPTVAPPPASPAPATTFTETFDGAPLAPLPWRSSRWDVTVHTRDQRSGMAPMHASHGADCAGPPAVHHVDRLADAVFQCNHHLMTAIADPGYGMIYLTPNQLVDFSGGVATVRFDLSTLRSSDRDWVDLWISPYEDHLQLALEDWLPDVQGEPRRGVHLRMDLTGPANNLTMFRAAVVRDFAYQRLPTTQDWLGYEQVLTPDAARRETFELQLSRTHIRFGLPRYNLWWVDTAIADLGWNQGVVQLGHHAYTPTKCAACAHNTWHWDTVMIAPAVPFTMVAGLERVADAQQGLVRLAGPTPAGGRLRFAGYGQRIELSVDGGRSWQLAPRGREERANEYAFHSYWVPIPPGVRAVQFRGVGDPLGNPWQVRAVAVWARP